MAALQIRNCSAATAAAEATNDRLATCNRSRRAMPIEFSSFAMQQNQTACLGPSRLIV